MPYPIDKKLVVGVSTTALFDFTLEHNIYLNEGLNAFREYQKNHKDDVPSVGSAFPFIKGLLGLNSIFSEDLQVEVVILSRNHPDVSPRVMNAIQAHDLNITRAVFRGGEPPYPFMKAVNAVLYLSTDAQEVKSAVQEGFPVGYVLPCKPSNQISENELRIAFDFDGVIVDDEAERVYAEAEAADSDGGLPLFHQHEVEKKGSPLNAGPLMPLLLGISELQRIEKEKNRKSIRVSIVTARNAPSHERLVNTLAASSIEADELFLAGGIEKKNFLDIIQPHIFFDDQLGHLKPASDTIPCVHIPFGIRNE